MIFARGFEAGEDFQAYEHIAEIFVVALRRVLS